MRYITAKPNRVRLCTIAAVAAVLAVAACSSSSTPTAHQASAAKQGGVLRIGTQSYQFSNTLDPTGEYTNQGWSALFPMLRTLVTYKSATGAAGLQVVPDLATALPAVSGNGLIYTFHLKPGIRFAPPVNRPITSKDIAYAFERINAAPLAAQYGFYYDGIIKGMTGTAPRVEPVSGIQTPDDTTIIFHLTRPTGDFVERLSMLATAPVPAEVAHCFTSPGTYGHYLVASGPYMIQGSPQLNISSCNAMKPVSGFTASHLVMVRNPNYKPSTAVGTGRLDYPNAITITIDSNVSDIFAKIQSGSFDANYFDVPPNTVLQQYATTSSLRNRLISTQSGAESLYLQLNLEAPPFDDIHVRKAVNYILDKFLIQKTWGGPVTGPIASHLIPPYVLGNVPASNFNLYPTPGNQGSLAKAETEMRQSRYDPNHDGKCDVSACHGIIMLTRNEPPWTSAESIIVSDLAKIGIQITPREVDLTSAFDAMENPKSLIPSQDAVRWVYDYPDPFPYYNDLFNSASITANANEDFSMVGLTAAKARSLKISYPAGGIPSIDSQISRCEAVPLGPSRNTCFAQLERYTMQNVVPMVPLIWENNLNIVARDVTHFEFTPEQDVCLTNIAVSNRLPVP